MQSPRSLSNCFSEVFHNINLKHNVIGEKLSLRDYFFEKLSLLLSFMGRIIFNSCSWERLTLDFNAKSILPTSTHYEKKMR